MTSIVGGQLSHDVFSTKFLGTYGTTNVPQCAKCKYVDPEDPFRCLAFPDGVPTDILTNKVVHDSDYDGGHGIHFEEA